MRQTDIVQSEGGNDGLHRVTCRRKKAGFSLLEIMIVVSIIGVAALIAIPSWMAARAKSNVTVCERNQKIMFEQMNIYCMERNKNCSVDTFADMDAVKAALFPAGGAKYIKSDKVFICPANPNPTETPDDYYLVRDGNQIVDINCGFNEDHNVD